MTPKLVPSPFTTKELSDITTNFQENKPDGEFIQDRHGYTHFVLDDSATNNNDQADKGLVVLTHGIGTSAHGLKELSKSLMDDGYSVLRYDFHGHGYSKYADKKMWGLTQDKDHLVDQLEDVLEYVCNERNKDNVVAIGGHSTGGLLCIAANHRWSTSENPKRKVVPKLLLLTPAFYAKKPLVARIADKIPCFMTGLFRTISAARVLVGDSYMENGEIAFARNPETQEYIYKDAQQKKTELDLRLFGRVKGVAGHPSISAAVFNLNNSVLRDDLLPGHRETFLKVLQMKDDAKNSDVLFLWGDLDLVVHYRDNIDEVQEWEKEYDNLTLGVVKNVGHESIYENSPALAEKIIPFLNK